MDFIALSLQQTKNVHLRLTVCANVLRMHEFLFASFCHMARYINGLHWYCTGLPLPC
jgi:hypothetical protein